MKVKVLLTIMLKIQARNKRQRLAAASHDTATDTARQMRRLFADGDEREEGDNDEDDDPTYEEPIAAPAPVAAIRQVAKGNVQYGKRLTKVGRDWLLEKCVKEDVFPKQKFANLDADLNFCNNCNSICRFMAEKMKVNEEDVEGWWESSKKAVHKKLKMHRNNVIKAIKLRFFGKKMVTDNCCYIVVDHHDIIFLTPSSPDVTTENVLAVTDREFLLQNFMGMRKTKTKAYVQLLDCLGRAVVGRKVYIENRMSRPLSEWFTLTDEAFLLLCLESYVDKWKQEWAQAPPADEAPQQQQDGGQQVDNDEARYTGRSQGTKRSWSKEGLERFNGLMVDVFRDRQVNGAHFDVIFREDDQKVQQTK